MMTVEYHLAKQKASCCRKTVLEHAITNGVQVVADYGHIVDLLRSKIGVCCCVIQTILFFLAAEVRSSAQRVG